MYKVIFKSKHVRDTHLNIYSACAVAIHYSIQMLPTRCEASVQNLKVIEAVWYSRIIWTDLKIWMNQYLRGMKPRKLLKFLKFQLTWLLFWQHVQYVQQVFIYKYIVF